jgi:hypothetical protein
VELDDRLTQAKSNKNAVALEIWTEKMAAAASLVNISEGGSSRSSGQAFDHAVKMVERFTALVGSGSPKIHQLIRPKASQ